MSITTDVLTGTNTDWAQHQIYARPDGSFVINIDGNTPFHVPNEGEFTDLYAAVQAHIAKNPDAVMPEPAPEEPAVSEEPRLNSTDLLRLAILEIHERLAELEAVNDVAPPVKDKDVISDIYLDVVGKGLKTIDEIPAERRAVIETRIDSVREKDVNIGTVKTDG